MTKSAESSEHDGRIEAMLRRSSLASKGMVGHLGVVRRLWTCGKVADCCCGRKSEIVSIGCGRGYAHVLVGDAVEFVELMLSEVESLTFF